jgi:hypothetical protein
MARSDIRGLVKRHPVASFFVLTYAVSWLAWLPAILGYRGGADTALSMIAQFGPGLLGIFAYVLLVRGRATYLLGHTPPEWLSR